MWRVVAAHAASANNTHLDHLTRPRSPDRCRRSLRLGSSCGRRGSVRSSAEDLLTQDVGVAGVLSEFTQHL